MTLDFFDSYGDTMASNSRVILLQDEQVALIWCEEGGETF
jgi:hypothetical protein